MTRSDADRLGPVLDNPRAERVKAVRRLGRRVARERTGRFVAEGPQAVREAVVAHARSGEVVLALYVTPDAADRYAEELDLARAAGLRPVPVTGEVLAAMTDTVTPQGLVAVCATVDRSLDAVLDDLAADGGPLLVAVLAHVRDPGNAGTVLRAADAAGADAVLLTEASVDVHNPKCVRSTAGSLFHLPVVQGLPVADAVAALRARGLTVLAADGAGDHDLDDLLDDLDRAEPWSRQPGGAHPGGAQPGAAQPGGAPDGSPLLARPTAWLLGNEAWGLPAEHRALADAVVRVPLHGRAESLNLATAATVCLYASARAHRRGRRADGATR
jgi:TrmH family RNA methyltransferase